MTELAHRFCRQATIVALITLATGIAVALDAIGTARGCPPLAALVVSCESPAARLAPEMPVEMPAVGLERPAGAPFRRG